MTERPVRLGFLVAVLALSLASVAVGQKLDTVIVRNGDRVTGEIKKLERGQLDYSTDDMGRLSVKWDKVLRLWSPFFFEVELTDGRKFFGSLLHPERDSVLVVSLIRADTVPLLDVVAITPIRQTFWNRLNGLIDFGFTFAQANKALTLTSNAEVQYRGEKAAVGVNGNVYLQRQTSTDATTRTEIAVNADYFFRRRWAATGVLRRQTNDELGLERRRTVTLSARNSIVQTNRIDFNAGGGVTGNNEKFATSAEATFNLEALLQARLDWFRYDTPKLDVVVDLSVYPSLTVKDRVRIEFNLRSDYELWKDFTIGLQFRDSYDSNPPDADLTKNDYTVSFTVGWKFNR